jgi:hypothetical protein
VTVGLTTHGVERNPDELLEAIETIEAKRRQPLE